MWFTKPKQSETEQNKSPCTTTEPYPHDRKVVCCHQAASQQLLAMGPEQYPAQVCNLCPYKECLHWQRPNIQKSEVLAARYEDSLGRPGIHLSSCSGMGSWCSKACVSLNVHLELLDKCKVAASTSLALVVHKRHILCIWQTLKGSYKASSSESLVFCQCNVLQCRLICFHSGDLGWWNPERRHRTEKADNDSSGWTK